MSQALNAREYSIPQTWEEWHKVEFHQRELRNGDFDSFAFLHRQGLLNKLSFEEASNLPELTALSTCDSLIFFEQILLLIDRAYKAKFPHQQNELLKSVERDELNHLRAFRTYAQESRLFKNMFGNGEQNLLPGQRGRGTFSWVTKIHLWQARKFPEYSYLYVLALELLSMEIGKRLLQDYGASFPDAWVQLNRLHLRDEAPHTKICLEHAAKIYHGLSVPKRILFWVLNYLGILYSGVASLGGIFRAFSYLTMNKKTPFWFRIRAVFVVMRMSSLPKSPFKNSMNAFRRMCESRFKDPISKVALSLLRPCL